MHLPRVEAQCVWFAAATFATVGALVATVTGPALAALATSARLLAGRLLKRLFVHTADL